VSGLVSVDGIDWLVYCWAHSLGVILGQWIDARSVGTHSWTFDADGCRSFNWMFNAIQFVAGEHASIQEEQLQEKTQVDSGSEKSDD